MTSAERNRAITRAVITTILGVGLVYLLYELRHVLLILYVSGLLAIGLSPAVRRIERSRFLTKGRRRLPRWLAVLSIYLAFLIGVVIILAMVVPPLVSQVRQLVANLPAYVDSVQRALVDRGLLQHDFNWSSVVANMQVPGVAISGLFGAVQGAIGVLGTLITVLLLPFYLLLESAQLNGWMLALVEPESRKRAGKIMRAVTVKVGAWLSGQLVLGLVIGTTATIGYALIGVPYFYVLGLLAAVGELIPVVGPILAAIPAVALGWTVSPQTAFYVLLFTWAQQFVENNVLVPRIMERQVGVSPVTIVVALLAGSALLGFAGAILAVPSAAIIQVMVQEFFNVQDDSDDDDP